MAAGHVQQTTDVLIAGHNFVDPALVHQFQVGMAVAFPEPLLGFQVRQLLAGQRRKHTAVLQVALNAVAGNPVTNDGRTLKCHLPQQLRLARPDGALDHVDVTAVTVDDLPAVTARRAKPDLRGFQHRDPKAVFQQKQRAGQACIASPDDTHVSLDLALQGGTFRYGIGRSCVIGLRVGRVRHPETPFNILDDGSDRTRDTEPLPATEKNGSGLISCKKRCNSWA